MTPASPTTSPYRGRLAPSPTGYLHLGHARPFWGAQERARARGGQMVLRNEDNDAVRFKLDFVAAMLEDLRWFGFDWQEGPDCGGPFGPYNQSERTPLYRAALDRLRAAGFVYPCTCSRKDIQSAARAPHAADDETLYPGTCRPVVGSKLPVEGYRLNEAGRSGEAVNPDGIRNQIEGGNVQSASWTLSEEVTFDRKSVTSIDWMSYPILDITEKPEVIDIVLIDRPNVPSSGAGEPSMRPLAAAIANAIFDATGVRIRRVPFTPERVKQAMS